MSIFTIRLLAMLAAAVGVVALGEATARFGRRAAYAVAIGGFSGLTLVWGIKTAFIPDPSLAIGLSPFVADADVTVGFLFVGGAWPLMTDHPRRRIPFAVLVILLSYWMLLAPVHLFFDGERIAREPGEFRDGMCIQPDAFTCAPASGTTMLRLWGDDRITLGEVAFHSGTAFIGTELVELARGIRGAGARTGVEAIQARTTIEELERIGAPVVTGIEVKDPSGGDIAHAVCILRLEGDRVLMGDPLSGPFELDRKGFFEKRKWDGTASYVGRDFLTEASPGERSSRVAVDRAALARAQAARAAPAGGVAGGALAARAAAAERAAAAGDEAAETLDAELAARVEAFRRTLGFEVDGGGRLDWRTRLAIRCRDPREVAAGRTLRGPWKPPPGTEGTLAQRTKSGEVDARPTFEPTSALARRDWLEPIGVVIAGLLLALASRLLRRRALAAAAAPGGEASADGVAAPATPPTPGDPA